MKKNIEIKSYYKGDRKKYAKVKERLAFFFEKKNYTNVESVHIIGY